VYTQFIHPAAAGGGTPEVIAFLNGIIVHGSLSLKNLVVKFTANVFAVSSGLPAAIQAPIITYGSVYALEHGLSPAVHSRVGSLLNISLVELFCTFSRLSPK